MRGRERLQTEATGRERPVVPQRRVPGLGLSLRPLPEGTQPAL